MFVKYSTYILLLQYIVKSTKIIAKYVLFVQQRFGYLSHQSLDCQIYHNQIHIKRYFHQKCIEDFI